MVFTGEAFTQARTNTLTHTQPNIQTYLFLEVKLPYEPVAVGSFVGRSVVLSVVVS